jgi:hypothetical protein
LQDILTRYAVEHSVSRSDDPGEIVYEDDWQVGVLPRTRREPTPLDPGVTLAPTTAGSKRALEAERRG